MSIGNLEEIESLIAMLAHAKERSIIGDIRIIDGEIPAFYEQFSDVFRNPLQAIGPALWLVGRWYKMGWCK